MVDRCNKIFLIFINNKNTKIPLNIYACMYVCIYVCITSKGSLAFLFLNTRLDYLEDLKVIKKMPLINYYFYLFKLFFYLLCCQRYYNL